MASNWQVVGLQDKMTCRIASVDRGEKMCQTKRRVILCSTGAKVGEKVWEIFLGDL